MHRAVVRINNPKIKPEISQMSSPKSTSEHPKSVSSRFRTTRYFFVRVLQEVIPVPLDAFPRPLLGAHCGPRGRMDIATLDVKQ